MPAVQTSFLAHDYLPILDVSAYVATMNERRKEDAERAAERDALFKRQALDIAEGFARLLADIEREGILEDNLAALRRFATEEFLSQKSTTDHLEREAESLTTSIRDMRRDKSQKAKLLVRETDALVGDILWLRDTVAIARDAYEQGLVALTAVKPKELTAENYATVRAIGEVIPKIKRIQEELVDQAKRRIDTSEVDEEERLNLKRALATLGGVVAGVAALSHFGIVGAVACSLGGALSAMKLASKVERSGRA